MKCATLQRLLARFFIDDFIIIIHQVEHFLKRAKDLNHCLPYIEISLGYFLKCTKMMILQRPLCLSYNFLSDSFLFSFQLCVHISNTHRKKNWSGARKYENGLTMKLRKKPKRNAKSNYDFFRISFHTYNVPLTYLCMFVLYLG